MDFAALFDAAPTPFAVLDTHLVIRYVNDALRQTDREGKAAALVGRYVFDALPYSAHNPQAVANVRAVLRRVLETGQTERLVLQRFDTPAPGRPGEFEERWWSLTYSPVTGPDGTVQWIIARAEEVTPFVHARQAEGRSGEGDRFRQAPLRREDAAEVDLYARARELQRMNEELRDAQTRDRQFVVALQEVMLNTPDLSRHENIAVRYLPAGSLNIGGDWYDVVDLPPDRVALAVGDVVGHGFEATAVMGMLRSALSAAIRAIANPAQAVEVVGLYSRSLKGALATTVIKVLIETRSRLIIYSNAGHVPPVLVHEDGSCDLLDQALDPPLGVRQVHVPRPQAAVEYRTGDILVLYTDGLIERHGEDIDVSLQRLTGILARCRALECEKLADTLLEELGVTGGASDDIALIVAHL